MGRPKLVDPPTKLKISIPQSLRTRLELFFFSALEGRVPQGAWSDYFCQLAREDLARRIQGKDDPNAPHS